jgi:hypothetical protein
MKMNSTSKPMHDKVYTGHIAILSKKKQIVKNMDTAIGW